MEVRRTRELGWMTSLEDGGEELWRTEDWRTRIEKELEQRAGTQPKGQKWRKKYE